MQTFLPRSNFYNTARVLDYRRLGKQRVEAKQILQILLNETASKAWRNHPAVLMWKGYEEALALYGYTMCTEWIKRGYKDTLKPYFLQRFTKNGARNLPIWLGNPNFHLSHQSNLLRKDFKHYSQYFKNVPDNLPYIWPITKGTVYGTTTS